MENMVLYFQAFLFSLKKMYCATIKFLNVNILFNCMCVYGTRVWVPIRASGTELQAVVSCLMRQLGLSSAPLEEQQAPLTTEPLPSPSTF